MNQAWRYTGKGEDALNDNETARQPQVFHDIARMPGPPLFCRARCDGASYSTPTRTVTGVTSSLTCEGLASTARRDDAEAQDDMLYLVDRLREAPGVREVVREKVASIAAWTDILFSDRKRATYGGDEEVTELLLHDCERLRAAIRGD